MSTFYFEVRTQSWYPVVMLATDEKAMATAYLDYWIERGRDDLEMVTLRR